MQIILCMKLMFQNTITKILRLQKMQLNKYINQKICFDHSLKHIFLLKVMLIYKIKSRNKGAYKISVSKKINTSTKRNSNIGIQFILQAP